MHPAGEPQLIITDDDEDDYYLAKSAFEKAGLRQAPLWVKDGQELLDLLKRDPGTRLVILDLNMPGMDGREALESIKAEPALKHIPIIVMTTSDSQEDVCRSYRQGVCSYIRKPIGFEEFVKAALVIKKYWLELVELPRPGNA